MLREISYKEVSRMKWNNSSYVQSKYVMLIAYMLFVSVITLFAFIHSTISF